MGQKEKKQGIRYYILTEKEIVRGKESDFDRAEKKVCVLTLENWYARSGWREVFQCWYDVDNIHYCKIESHKEFIFFAFHIPARKSGEIPTEFALFMKKELMVILVREEKNYQEITGIIEGITKKNLSVAEFLYYFLQAFLSEDLYFIEEMEREIAKIEENVLEGTIHQFSHRMLRMKKMIARFYHYYSQLVEMGQELLENQGINQGISQGINQGISQNQRETALRLLKRGKQTVEEIAEDTGLSVNDVQQLDKLQTM